jgi:hypothetical protein
MEILLAFWRQTVYNAYNTYTTNYYAWRKDVWMAKTRWSLAKEPLRRAAGSALYLLPLLLAVCAVQPWPLAFAGCLLALWLPMEKAGARAAGLTLVLLQDIALRHFSGVRDPHWGIAALLCLALTGELVVLYYARRQETKGLAQGRESEGMRRLARILRPPAALYPGASAGAAVMMTLYQGSGYFAVGAQGAGIPALLRSYRNLGFHPNWRTVLFSTIMLVVLIAWPRKFKSLSKVLPAGFAGVVLVTALNLLLNPLAGRSTVAELPLHFLPFLRRMPISALSMLLIYTAWEEVPWKKIKACFRERRGFDMVLLALIPAAMLRFDLLWVCAGAALVWGAACAVRYAAQWRKGRGAQNSSRPA